MNKDLQLVILALTAVSFLAVALAIGVLVDRIGALRRSVQAVEARVQQLEAGR